MDTLFLHGLKAETLIGVYDWERQQRQTLLLDVDIGTDARPAGHSDNIDDTIHYGDVAEALRHNLAQQQFLLLPSAMRSFSGRKTGVITWKDSITRNSVTVFILPVITSIINWF